MAKSFARSVASGLTAVFSVPFPYLDKTHVSVFVDGTLLDPSAYSWPTTASVELTAGAPVAGAVVERRRITPSEVLTTFTPGNLDTGDLNAGVLQPLYLAQEADDKADDLIERGWVTKDLAVGGTIEKGGDGYVAAYDADGNLVPGMAIAPLADANYQLLVNRIKEPTLRDFKPSTLDPLDWGATIAAAVASGEPVIKVHGGDIPVADSIEFSTGGQSFIGESWRQGEIRRTTAVDEPFIRVTAASVKLQIGVRGPGRTGMSLANIGILVERPAGNLADLDFEFCDSYLTGFYLLGQSWGRGVKVRNNVLSGGQYAWDVEWPADADYLEGPEWHQKKATGFRRLEFEGNEAHALGVAMVRNRGLNKSKANLWIANNKSNIGDGLLGGALGPGSHVIGNNVWGATGVPLTIEDGSKDYFVIGNKLMGTLEGGQTGAATYLIELTGAHQNGSFYSNDLGYCKAHAIRVGNTGACTGMAFKSTMFTKVCSDIGANNPIIFIGDGHTAVVTDAMLRDSPALDAMVRTTSALSDVEVTGAFHLGGTTQAVKGAGTRGVQRFSGIGLADRSIRMGTATPEGSVIGVVGDLYISTAGGAGTTLYVKGSGANTNTGWIGLT